jgi:hypothetical protein
MVVRMPVFLKLTLRVYTTSPERKPKIGPSARADLSARRSKADGKPLLAQC